MANVQRMKSFGLLFPLTRAQLRVMPNDPPFDRDNPRPSSGKRIHQFGGTIWWQECGRKLAHFTVEMAEVARMHMENKKGYNKVIYICRWCDWFHCGHEWDGGPTED